MKVISQVLIASAISLCAFSAFAASSAQVAAANPAAVANNGMMAGAPAQVAQAQAPAQNNMMLAAASGVAAPVAPAASNTYSSNGPDISGTYTCTGWDPFGKTNFNSTVTVTKNRDTYSFQWLSNGYPYNLGTGLYHKDSNDMISVVFWNPKKPDYFGTEVFQVKPDGSLSANWTVQAESQVGSESCTKNK